MAEPFLQEFCCACSLNWIHIFNFRHDLMFTVVQVGMRHSVCHGHETFFGCPSLVQNSLLELEMLPSHPSAPLHGSLESLCLTQISCHSAHQWWVSTYTAVSSACLGPPPWGRTGTQSVHNSLHKYSPPQRLLRQAWRQQRLSMDFLL